MITERNILYVQPAYECIFGQGPEQIRRGMTAVEADFVGCSHKPQRPRHGLPLGLPAAAMQGPKRWLVEQTPAGGPQTQAEFNVFLVEEKGRVFIFSNFTGVT